MSLINTDSELFCNELRRACLTDADNSGIVYVEDFEAIIRTDVMEVMDTRFHWMLSVCGFMFLGDSL